MAVVSANLFGPFFFLNYSENIHGRWKMVCVNDLCMAYSLQKKVLKIKIRKTSSVEAKIENKKQQYQHFYPLLLRFFHNNNRLTTCWKNIFENLLSVVTISMTLYNLTKSKGYDMMRFFQAVSTKVFRHGSWLPEKTSSYIS